MFGVSRIVITHSDQLKSIDLNLISIQHTNPGSGYSIEISSRIAESLMIAQHKILPERNGERGPGRRKSVVIRGSPIVQIARDENDIAFEPSYFCYEPADGAQVPDVPEVNIAHQRCGAATPRLRKILELHRDAFTANCGRIDNAIGAAQQSR